VAGAAIYCCGYESIQWQPYDIWPDAVQMLARQARPVYPLYETPEPPPSPTPDELDRLLRRLDEVIALLEERI
jgi:hypothetical protein